MRFNPEDYVDYLLSQGDALPPDITIDDSSILLAKNCIEFCTKDYFLGSQAPKALYPRQVELLVKLNAEYCPRCTNLDFWGDSKKLSSMAVNEKLETIYDNVQLLEYGICPKCGAKKSDLYKSGELKVPLEFVGLLGQRSGKTAVSTLELAYLIHGFLKTPNLSKTYDLLPNSPFAIPIVALTFEKAKTLIYSPLYNYLTKSNWFKTYCELLDNYAASNGLKVPLYDIKDTFTWFRHKNILIVPSGPDKRKLRGYTSIASAIDEVGWFVTNSDKDLVKLDADEIYKAINNSMPTAKVAYLNLLKAGYNNIPSPININISSPSSKKDMICRLYNQSKTDPLMYGVHLATWEFNPVMPENCELMQSYRKKMGKDFMRDFGAVPPDSTNAFIPTITMMSDCRLKTLSNICTIRQREETVSKAQYTTADIVTAKSIDNRPRVLAIDAGYTNNSFALAIAELSEVNSKKVIFNLLTEIIPDETAPINYSGVYNNIILPLIKKYNVKMVCTDRWQNIKLLSDIDNDASLFCTTKTYSVKYDDFLFYKTCIMDKNIVIPNPEVDLNMIYDLASADYPHSFMDKPISHYYLQAITVSDNMGKSVTKGDGLTDDIFRASVLAHAIITNDKYASIFTNNLPSGMVESFCRALGAMPSGMSTGGTTKSRVGAVPSGNSYSNSRLGARPGS